MTQLSSSEAESLDSGLTFEVRSPDLTARKSVEITVQPEKDQQEVEEAQDRLATSFNVMVFPNC